MEPEATSPQLVTVTELKNEVHAVTEGKVNLRYADYTSIAGHDCFIMPVKPSRRIQFLDAASQAEIQALASEYGWSLVFDPERPVRGERSDAICQARVILGLSTDLAMDGPNSIRVRIRGSPHDEDDEDEYPTVPGCSLRRRVFDAIGVWIVPLSDDDPLFHADDAEEDSESDGSLVDFVVPDEEVGEGLGAEPDDEAVPMSVDDEVRELREEAIRLGADLSGGGRPSRGAAARARERIRHISIDSDSDSDP